MRPNARGRFCDHCQTSVTDFTTWTDAAIYHFLRNNTGQTCGRFLSTQLNRPITIPYQPHSQLYRIAVAMGFTLIFSQTPQLLAQNRPPRVEQASVLKVDDKLGGHSGVIRGTVVDIKKRPIPNVTIRIYKDELFVRSTTSDSEGNYGLKNLASGSYTILAICRDCISKKFFNVEVLQSTPTTINLPLAIAQKSKDFHPTYDMGMPLIQESENNIKRTFNRDELKTMPR